MKLPLVQIAPTAPGGLLLATGHIRRNSVIVLWVKEPGTVVLDFEGGLYERPEGRTLSAEERTQYALRAGGRAAEQYPTVARLWLEHARPHDFVHEGWIDTETWAIDWFLASRPLAAFPDPLPPKKRQS